MDLLAARQLIYSLLYIYMTDVTQLFIAAFQLTDTFCTTYIQNQPHRNKHFYSFPSKQYSRANMEKYKTNSEKMLGDVFSEQFMLYSI